ncbi:GNAT family N-acetyltransferase [Salipiger aestuarii]|uniref:Acetyltransferase (GNAT) family protein n=1 Tax=Salipiger aestuarii TaxID=568098 RepID=A0A327XZ78_9RHOB|nr:GNAT family N-acetyltransferase [Salipiger aestuarii]EIE48710.1 N-acetyltransferase [Citreicella sp. 357]KAA8610561.1 acetyltransferase [Salipiger aestuarii]KAB2541310.1 acetyltransferase [Salipiger aestuarii]RAK13914.1 acetyltransferase (GNAT) family protein [Salipiger aestuarii]
MTVLRCARSTDAGALGAMMTDAAPAWKPRLHSGAEDIAHVGTMIDRGWVTVATDPEGRRTGFIALEDGYVHALFIAPAHRRSGVGRALIDAARRAQPRLDLWTFQSNTAARRFYESTGFVEIGRGDGSRNDEGLPDIHYRWERARAPRQERHA